MKIAVIGVIHETNTFAPGLTQIEAFQSEWVHGNEAFLHRYSGTRTSMGGAIDAVAAAGAELSVGFYTAATPSGMVTKETVNTIIEALVESADTSADGIVVILHGAMVAEGMPDVEGEILRRVREKMSASQPIALTLDLHANISKQMVENADIIVGYDTYPHIDMYERADEAVQLLVRTLKGEIKPVNALAQPQMIVVPQVMLTDKEGPMKDIMDRAFAIEQDPKVLNVTVAGGFPYSDVPDAGIAFVVTVDGDLQLAEQYGAELNKLAWDLREQLRYADHPPDQAVAMAMELTEGPVILVEGSDNVGGGAPADATHTLVHLIDPPKKSLIVIYDPEAALEAHRLGVGAAFDAEVGGKSDKLHGDPVRIQGEVRLLSDGKYTHIGKYMTGKWAYMGKTAVIEAGNLTLIITEERSAPWDPGHVSSVGLRAEDFHVIVVKSAVAWKTAFGSICRAIVPVDTPGCCGSNLSHFSYEQLRHPIFPLDVFPE
ncbi:M81 family metallopeptidase [Paenibacillus eucommiae]|uniref:Microcystin degradation protein MlrC n=1 Tax=Paenibacillus eucommiae TaxID=1355755 RepID=A0ABS4J0M9_9BACL|nr:M81 family metallopeptidase [Paenibacillus eucommiae]MBP1993394.1 microcystin degradation protein MlrC [Paenibacillus eucommiae]